MNLSAASTTEASWRALESWPAQTRPTKLWPYLAEIGSLTERLRARAGREFHVQLLKQGRAALAAQDAASLSARPGDSAFVRQVYLCGKEPWVYARSLALGEGERWLTDLGKTPLGQKVFAEPETRRGPIEAAEIGPADPLYRDAMAGLAFEYTRPLWARRSLLNVNGAAILIYECFLPGLS